MLWLYITIPMMALVIIAIVIGVVVCVVKKGNKKNFLL